MRLATWNMKQAVAPKKPLPELWNWMESSIDPDVIVLTEARVPKAGLPTGWSALWEPDGVGPRRRWSVVIAGRGVDLAPVREVRTRFRTHEIRPPWPATLEIAEVSQAGKRWATVVGLYGLTVNANGKSCGHGGHSVRRLLDALEPLLDSKLAKDLVIAGDLNLWPRDVSYLFEERGLIDLIEWTGNDRGPLEGCANCADLNDPECAHLWTHKNGNSPNAARQQIDFIFASEKMANELGSVHGGVQGFPDAWDVSDHAPVVADFLS